MSAEQEESDNVGYDQNIRKSNDNEREDNTENGILAFELVDSNSNGTDLEDSLISQNLSCNISSDDLTNKLDNTSATQGDDLKNIYATNTNDMDTGDSNEILECDSIISNQTSGIDSMASENLNLNSLSLNDFKNSDVKEPTGQVDTSLQDYTNSENDVICTEIPNGITKTVLTEELKNNASTAKPATYTRKKLKKIWEALENEDIDFLREAAITRGGLLNDEVRKKVWPKLAGVDLEKASPRPTLEEIQAHLYYQQVVLDVNRSLKRFPPSIKEAQRLTMLDQLVFLIMRVLCRNPELHYYQGYHDICVTFLLVLGEETAYHVVEKLSRTHLKEFMEVTMEPTIHLLEYIYNLIGKKNPLLKNFLTKSEVGVAYCLSWLITWFGHVLNDYDSVVRLFDLFIVSHPWMPMYLTSAVVLHREAEVLKQDCDMASVHSLLANIPDDLPFEELIWEGLILYKHFTPKMLSHERPYIKRSKGKTNTGWRLIQSVSKRLKSAVPGSSFTLPLVIAAAVLVTAVLYQAYKH